MTLKTFVMICLTTLIVISSDHSFAEVEITNELVSAIIEVESGGDPYAVSPKGCIGLMQISPIVFREFLDLSFSYEKLISAKDWEKYVKETYGETIKLGNPNMMIGSSITTLYNPYANKVIGTWYLKRLRDHYLKDLLFYHIEGGFMIEKKNGIRFPSFTYKIPQIKTINDFELALILAAYNGGISRLKKVNYDINKMPKSTQNYINKVLKIMEKK